MGTGLSLLLASGSSPLAADEGPGREFQGTCQEVAAPFLETLSLTLTERGAMALFGNSQDQKILARFVPGQDPRLERRDRGVDGFSEEGGRILVWRREPGQLVLIDGDGFVETLWQGGPIHPPGARLARDRAWWLSEVDGRLRVGRLELSEPSATRAPAWSPVLPAADPEVAVFLSGRAAVAAGRGTGEVWSWSGGDRWEAVAAEPDLRLAGAEGRFLLARHEPTSAWLVADLEQARPLSWKPLRGAEAAGSFDPRRVEILGEHGSFTLAWQEEGGGYLLARVAGETGIVGESRVELPPPTASGEVAWSFDGDRFVTTRQRGARLWLEYCWKGGGEPEPPAVAERETEGRVAEAEEPPPPVDAPGSPRSIAGGKALRWLTAQLGPTFSTEDGRVGRLIDSYEDDQRVGWVYDAALAVMVFTASGRFDVARELLTGLEALQGEDGAWPFSFDPDRVRALGGDRYVGSIAWVVMATNFFEWETGERSFSEMAGRALRFVARYLASEPSEREFGALAMGPGRESEYSTEHNADGYSAFLWRGRLEDDRRLLQIAERIRRFMVGNLWAEEARGPGSGHFKVGSRDSTLYLDPQTWTTLSLGAEADAESSRRFGLALEAAERDLLLEAADVVGFNEALGPDVGSKVWPEGTEGMVAALRTIGRMEKADYYHRQTARLQAASGGIPYATANVDGWSTAPAVASTCWFLLNELSRNPFHPPATTAPGADGRSAAEVARRF